MTSPPSLSNPVKDRLRAGQPAIGLNVRICRTPEIARVAKMSGHDFLFIDTQHSIFDLETIINIAGLATAIGVAPLVRVRGVDDPDVATLLDNGVAGIVYPDIATPEDARRAVQTVRFPPRGRRSASGNYPQFNLQSLPVLEATRQIDEATLLVLMVESAEGLANVEEIAAVPGVDVVHLGSNDLLVSLGKGGQFDDPVLRQAQDRVIGAAKANGIYAGCGGNRDPQRQADAIRRGAQFLTAQSDVALLTQAAIAWAKDVRAAL